MAEASLGDGDGGKFEMEVHCHVLIYVGSRDLALRAYRFC